MTNFLMELAAVHLALMLGYRLFLRKERQYDAMRFYLVGSVILALIIPLLKLPSLFASEEAIYSIAAKDISYNAVTITATPRGSSFNYGILVWIYLAISGLLLIRYLRSLFYLINLYRKSVREKLYNVHIRRLRNVKGSFTFFRWIFVGDDIDTSHADYQAVLNHERAHVTLGHSYDIVFFELFKVCFWWLPTAWLINKEIREIHEYQADGIALKSCDVDEYSSVLINSTLKSYGLALASSFDSALILKRLIVMKQQAKKVSPWKLGALGVLCASLFVAFACSETVDQKSNDSESLSEQMDGKVFTVVEAQPEYEGGIGAFRKYIMEEIKYPLQARQTGIEGRVDVQFVVEKDGSVSDVKVIKGIGAGCDAEAVRVLSGASFKPGTQNGKPVRVRMEMPIVFKLNEGQTNPDNSTQGIVIVEEVQPKNNRFKVDAHYANGEWSGTVYDEEGDGLPGVNIVVMGTTRGTVSDLNGNFKMKADESQALSLSFVGYEIVRLEGK